MIRILLRDDGVIFEKDGDILFLPRDDLKAYAETVQSMFERATVRARKVTATLGDDVTTGDAPEYPWELEEMKVRPAVLELYKAMGQPHWMELNRSDHYFEVIRKWPRVKSLSET